MTYGGGYGSGSSDPFGGSSDPFGGQPFGGSPAGSGYGSGPAGFGGPGYGAPPPSLPGGGSSGGPGGGGFGGPPPSGEVNTLSTLSIVFAILFAPVGAVLGHVALHQIRERDQRGRDRAVVGLVLSYLIIVLAVIALIVWLVLGGDEEPAPSVVSSTPTTTTTKRPTPPKTTVVTAAPTERPTVRVEQLRVGDCVEVQQNERVPGDPNSSYIFIYRTSCQVRDGVVRVNQIVSNESQCAGGFSLFNKDKTVWACVSDFKG